MPLRSDGRSQGGAQRSFCFLRHRQRKRDGRRRRRAVLCSNWLQGALSKVCHLRSLFFFCHRQLAAHCWHGLRKLPTGRAFDDIYGLKAVRRPLLSAGQMTARSSC